jgi:hypothetical protein
MEMHIPTQSLQINTFGPATANFGGCGAPACGFSGRAIALPQNEQLMDGTLVTTTLSPLERIHDLIALLEAQRDANLFWNRRVLVAEDRPAQLGQTHGVSFNSVSQAITILRIQCSSYGPRDRGLGIFGKYAKQHEASLNEC